MKYKWIDLQNYAGIYNGMQLNQINIDLTKCKTNKILIRGLNGSGKSTIMNAINVNPDSNDNFIPNMEARKNLCIVDNGVEYIIRYIHPVTASGSRGTTKGYISKCVNGNVVELNPNGNISSCKDIIYEEFNLDANFMALSQLSSEDRGLVDRKPAERKKLLNNIINILETYNNIYKILNKKAGIFKSTVNSLVYKIDSIGDETTLKLNLNAIETRIDKAEKEKAVIIESIAAVKIKMNEFISILQNNNYNNLVDELNTLSKVNKSSEVYINKMLSEYGIDNIDKVKDFLNHLEIKIIEIQSEIDSYNKQVQMLLLQRSSESDKLAEKTAKLNSLQSEYNYSDVKRLKLEAEQTIIKYDAIFKEMKLLNVDSITKSEFDAAMESLEYLLDAARNLMSSCSIDDISYVYNNSSVIGENANKIQKIKFDIEVKRNNLSEMQKELYKFESMREIAKQLSNRPSNCNIDSCPYIKSAIEADNQYPESAYNSLLINIENLKESISKDEEFINKTTDYASILMSISAIQKELKSKMKFISKLPVRRDFESSFISRMISGDPFDDISNLYKYIDCGNFIEEYKIAKQNLSKLEVEWKIYESKNDIIESILKDISDLNNKLEELSSNITTINNSISTLNNELVNTSKARDKILLLNNKINDEYIPSMNRENELRCSKELLENNNIELNKLQNDLSRLNNSLGVLDTEIKSISNDRDSIKHSIQLLSEYKKELEIYSTKYTKIDKIKYYASPNTGIQTLFMELYMNKTINIANDLLSRMFKGEFTLQPFIINENEFRIPCVGDGLMHDDISSMSTAQKCIISMILSFSLLYQSSTKYNIIKLDELDAFLDTSNRSFFITLLNDLMSLLKCEQCFIVSHNAELSSYECDIILLKNNGLVGSNENIIWQY